MSNYKIVFNIPNEKFPTEVSVTSEQMEILANSLNEKKIIKINGNFFNTAYFAKAVPDIEANRIENPNYMQIEERSQSTNIKTNREELDKLRSKLFKK